jgi:hypothetical protein
VKPLRLAKPTRAATWSTSYPAASNSTAAISRVRSRHCSKVSPVPGEEVAAQGPRAGERPGRPLLDSEVDRGSRINSSATALAPAALGISGKVNGAEGPVF